MPDEPFVDLWEIALKTHTVFFLTGDLDVLGGLEPPPEPDIIVEPPCRPS